MDTDIPCSSRGHTTTEGSSSRGKLREALVKIKESTPELKKKGVYTRYPVESVATCILGKQGGLWRGGCMHIGLQ